MFIIDEYGKIRFFIRSFNSCQAAIDFIMKYGTDDAPENLYVAHYFKLNFDIKKSFLLKRDVNQWTKIMRNLIGIARIQRTLQITDVLGGNIVYYKLPNNMGRLIEKEWNTTIQVAVYHTYSNHINIKTLGNIFGLTSFSNIERIIGIMVNEIGIYNARKVAEKLSPLTEE